MPQDRSRDADSYTERRDLGESDHLRPDIGAVAR